MNGENDGIEKSFAFPYSYMMSLLVSFFFMVVSYLVCAEKPGITVG